MKTLKILKRIAIIGMVIFGLISGLLIYLDNKAALGTIQMFWASGIIYIIVKLTK